MQKIIYYIIPLIQKPRKGETIVTENRSVVTRLQGRGLNAERMYGSDGNILYFNYGAKSCDSTYLSKHI
jgi:hypothetical protein